jgi:acetyltransferase-like isoleucine patch superfamily enzyme
MKCLILNLIRIVCRYWCMLHGAKVSRNALIHGFPHIKIKAGGQIILDDGVTLNIGRWSNPLNDSRGMNLYAGPGAIIRFGKNSGASTSRIIAYADIHIGAGSLIGAGCLICDSDMHEVPLGADMPVKCAPIHIGKHVFIGANCTILKGVRIGDGAVIGAGSVVTGDIPPATLTAGQPARVLRELSSPS